RAVQPDQPVCQDVPSPFRMESCVVTVRRLGTPLSLLVTGFAGVGGGFCCNNSVRCGVMTPSVMCYRSHPVLSFLSFVCAAGILVGLLPRFVGAQIMPTPGEVINLDELIVGDT